MWPIGSIVLVVQALKAFHGVKSGSQLPEALCSHVKIYS